MAASADDATSGSSARATSTHEIDPAWATVRRARESGRLNPRRRRAADRVRVSDDFAALLSRIEQATADTRSMARTMGGSTGSLHIGTRTFRETLIDLLARTGDAIFEADVDGLERAREDIEAAGRSLSAARTGACLPPEHGALLVNLRNIADAMGGSRRAAGARRGARPSRAAIAGCGPPVPSD